MISMIGRLLGLSASVGTIGLWSVFSFLNPYGYQGFSNSQYLIAGVMTILAIVGLTAALQEKPYIMLAVFGLSFIPVGLYLLGTPGIFKWIGVFNLLLLCSALIYLVPLYIKGKETDPDLTSFTRRFLS